MKLLFQRLFKHPWLSFELLLSSLFINILGLASTVYIIQVLNRYVNHGIDATLYTLTSGVLIAIAMDFAFKIVRVQLAESISSEIATELPAKAFGVLTHAKAGALNQLDMGLKREIMGGLNKVQLAFAPNSIITVLDMPYAIVFLCVLGLLSPFLATIACIYVFSFVLLTIFLNSRIKNRNKEQSELAANHSGMIGSTLRACDDIRGFNAKEHLLKRWMNLILKSKKLSQSMHSIQGFNTTVTYAGTAILGVIMIGFGAKLVVDGDLTIGGMIGCNILAARALSPINRFASISAVFNEASESLKLLEKFNQLPLETKEGSQPENFNGDLEIKNLTFSYASSPAPLFKQLNVTIPKGSFVVICGKNGVGKTTLARLLINLMQPNQGQFLIDGIDLRQFNINWWREQIIYFPQEPVFFDGTLRENLVSLNPELSDDKVKELVDKVGLSQYVDLHPQGVERPIVDGGLNMAKGLRRRLAFARALTKDGQIAIIDEPGDGMDVEGSKMVFESVTEFIKQGKTVILFSHQKPETFKNAHSIIDLNQQPIRILKNEAKQNLQQGNQS